MGTTLPPLPGALTRTIHDRRDEYIAAKRALAELREHRARVLDQLDDAVLVADRRCSRLALEIHDLQNQRDLALERD